MVQQVQIPPPGKELPDISPDEIAIADTRHSAAEVLYPKVHDDPGLADTNPFEPYLSGSPGENVITGNKKPETANDTLEEKLHHYFEGAALTKLIAGMDTDPKKQQEIIRLYVQEIVLDILPHITCDNAAGALLNLDYPSDFDTLEKQTMQLIETVEDASHDNMFNLLQLFGEVKPAQFRKMEEEINSLQERLSALDKDDPERAIALDELKKKYPAYMALYKEVDKSKKEIVQMFKSTAERVRKDVLTLLTNTLSDSDVYTKIYMLGVFYGKGGIGTVHSCRMGGHDLAVKLYHPDLKFKPNHDMNLIEATKSSPNLMRFYGSLGFKDNKTEEGQRQIDIFEEVRGGMNLADYMKGIAIKTDNPDNAGIKTFFGSIFLPFLRGVKALHERKLIHRDLKPENVMIVPGADDPEFGKISALKITDYDLIGSEGKDTAIVGGAGSPHYMSPEQWVNSPDMTCKSDIFSLGMILYQFFGGVLPGTVTGIFHKVVYEGDLDIQKLNAPPSVKKVITECTQKNPADRPDIDTLINYAEALANGMDPISPVADNNDMGDYDEVVIGQ